MHCSITSQQYLHEVALNVYREIKKQALAVGNTDLCGWCAKASLSLYKVLVTEGLPAKLCVWQSREMGHCYVVCDDYLIDITAEQFGMKPVEITPLSNPHKPMFWKARRRFMDEHSFVAYLEKHRWHKDSVPNLCALVKP